jgi:hypothetical protein
VPAEPIDFSNATQRDAVVKAAVPTIQKKLDSSTGTAVNGNAINDTSFINGADPRLAKPFLVGFNASAILVYWVAMFVVLIAFVLTLFFKTPPLRAKSALQEAADNAAADQAKAAADEMGVLVEAGVSTASNPVIRSSGGSPVGDPVSPPVRDK